MPVALSAHRATRITVSTWSLLRLMKPIIAALMEGLKDEVICRNDRLKQLLHFMKLWWCTLVQASNEYNGSAV